jgi:exodeoxyribonuclease VII large subunit
MTLSLLDPAPDTGAITVSQLNAAVKGVVEAGLGPLWVQGEITGLKAYASGHWYFTLRDARSQVRCCMWKTYSQRTGGKPAEGAQVFVLARPGMWEEKGEFRLSVQKLLITSEVGTAALEFDRVRRLLQADGLFDPLRKRPLPEYPRTIAMVTSPDGAALRDVISVVRARWPFATLLVFAARVQGEGAAEELCRALTRMNRTDGIDVCIVGRGGGAREDLAAFNDERVCRALAAARVPTISAVGHETDVTLADLVADLRAATPSNAAELAVPDILSVRRRLAADGARLANGLTRRTRLVAERLARSGDRLQSAMESRSAQRRARLERLAAQLDALSPLRVLARGYAVPTAPDGRLLRRRSDFRPGDAFNLRVADGDVAARAE